MQTSRIDFISAYCDRWCERCRYTARCSVFAVQAAVAMCGDFREGLELAVGASRPVEPSSTPGEPQGAWASFANVEPTEQELRDIQRLEAARDSRIDNTPIMKSAWTMMKAAHRWFGLRSDAVRAAADSVLREALDIAQWDSTFVGAKLSRALNGRDSHDHDDDVDDDPLPNDWNGSAKVALISLERSEAAWQVIAQSTGDLAAADLARQVAELRREVDRAFPNARRFIRPGFDEPHR
jgi:hypothetical protein